MSPRRDRRYSSCPAVSIRLNVTFVPSTEIVLLYVSSIVGLYSKLKTSRTNWRHSADFPTLPSPMITT